MTDDEDLASSALRHGADAWVSRAADAPTIAATIRIFDRLLSDARTSATEDSR